MKKTAAIDRVPGSESADKKRRRLLAICGMVCFLALFAFQYSRIANANSLTWDEGNHIYAGYMSWMHRDFGLNPEHPPLVKLVATLPLLGMQFTMPPLLDRRYEVEAFLGGKDFIYKNDANTIAYRARMAAMLFTLLLATVVFLTARELFGQCLGCHRTVAMSPPAAAMHPLRWWRSDAAARMWAPEHTGPQCRVAVERRVRPRKAVRRWRAG